MPAVSPVELEQALRELPKIGTLVKSHEYREIWRFEFGGKPFYLKFYPRAGSAMKRLIRGSPALREFANLQALQRAKIPSPRAVAQLSGFSIGERKGDAVILEGIEPSVQLDRYLSDKLLMGDAVPVHRALAKQVIAIVQQLGAAKLGHDDLHLGNFLLQDGKLFLLDGYAVEPGGMKMEHILTLGLSVQRFATKTDILGGWRTFTSADLPLKNRMRKRQWRKFLEASVGENRYFTHSRFREPSGAEWTGHSFKHHKFPRRWAPMSGRDLSKEDWEKELPRILDLVRADSFEILKRSPGGDVLAGEIVLGGKPVDVVIKRNRRRKWYRYLNEIGRGGRAIRAWRKAWSLVVRDIPTAWPLAVIERRVLGYTIDSLILFERVRGTQLSDMDLAAMTPAARQDLFRRLGRTLRLLEAQGLKQYDSKFTNWIIQDDPKLGPVPVMIDVDGIRPITPPMWPIDRLLRSMRQHPQYTPADSKELCLGYAPYARLEQEQLEWDDHDEGQEDGEEEEIAN